MSADIDCCDRLAVVIGGGTEIATDYSLLAVDETVALLADLANGVGQRIDFVKRARGVGAQRTLVEQFAHLGLRQCAEQDSAHRGAIGGLA